VLLLVSTRLTITNTPLSLSDNRRTQTETHDALDGNPMLDGRRGQISICISSTPQRKKKFEIMRMPTRCQNPHIHNAPPCLLI